MIVNRVWRWHFGRGLVASVDNFGRLGQPPAHPELLDWLASRLLEQGWSLKRLHREVMLSKTYQMSTRWNEHAASVDPEGAYLWRMPRRRLDAEELRDSILFVTGQLDRKMGGTPLKTTPFQDLSAGGVSRSPALYESTRRSIYLPVLRGAVYEVYRTFDFPDPASSSGDRAVTTVAAQALFMMNSSIMERASANLAASLLGDGRGDAKARMARACRCVLGREATAEEIDSWGAFLDRYQSAAAFSGQDPAIVRCRAWQGLCRALLSSNEFVYVE